MSVHMCVYDCMHMWKTGKVENTADKGLFRNDPDILAPLELEKPVLQQWQAAPLFMGRGMKWIPTREAKNIHQDPIPVGSVEHAGKQRGCPQRFL